MDVISALTKNPSLGSHRTDLQRLSELKFESVPQTDSIIHVYAFATLAFYSLDVNDPRYARVVRNTRVYNEEAFDKAVLLAQERWKNVGISDSSAEYFSDQINETTKKMFLGDYDKGRFIRPANGGKALTSKAPLLRMSCALIVDECRFTGRLTVSGNIVVRGLFRKVPDSKVILHRTQPMIF